MFSNLSMTSATPMRTRGRKTAWQVLTAVAAAVMFSSCASDGGTGPAPVVALVEVSGAPTEGVVLQGATAQLTAVAKTATGTVLERPITWQSSDNSIATVSPTGLVTGVAAGPVDITATAEGVAGEVLISVRQPITVPPAGGAPTTTTVLGGAVTVTVPPAATGTTTQLTVAPAAAPPADTRVLASSTFDFGPAGTVFTTPITIELAYNPALVPASKEEDVRIYLVGNGGALTLVPGGSVDVVTNKVSAPVTHFSTYATVVPADPTQMTVTAGNNQSATFNTAVAVAPSVTVRDAQNRPVAFADVTFAVASGGGNLSGATEVETNENGVATLPGTWTLGPTSGANSLNVTVAGTAVSAVVTATATAPATQLAVTAGPTAATSGVPFATALTVEVRDQFGALVPSATAVSVAITAGSGTLVGTTTVNAVNGVATFGGLRINGAGAHTLEVTAAGLSSATRAVAVTQQIASVAILTQPTGAVSNIAFTTQPVIELRDNAGLRVLDGTAAVTASKASGAGALYGDLTVNAVAGVATFTGLAIEGTGAHTLSFTTAGVTAVTSAGFDVGAGATGIRVRLGALPAVNVAPGGTVTIPVSVDLSNRGADDIASLTVTVTWDTDRFDYTSNTAGAWTDAGGGAASVLVNDTQTANGSIGITGFTTGATTASFILRTITLTAKPSAQSVQSTVQAAIGAAGNAAGNAITVTPRPLAVTIAVQP